VYRSLSSCIPLLAQKECSQARCTLTEEAGLIYDLYCRSRESISMEIIASAIFGRSSFTFRLSRMISFTYQYAHCPSNRIYKRALAVFGLVALIPSEAKAQVTLSVGPGYSDRGDYQRRAYYGSS